MDATAICRKMMGDEGLTRELLGCGVELMLRGGADEALLDAGFESFCARAEKIAGGPLTDDELLAVMDRLIDMLESADSPLS